MNESSSRTLEQMQDLATRLKNNPDFMAGVIAHYQKVEHLSDIELTEFLDTTPAVLTRLALCKRPNSDSVNFSDQMRQIAAYTGIDPALLANLVRQIDSLQALSMLPSKTEMAEEPVTDRLQPGLLAAARDRSEDGENDSDDSPSHNQEIHDGDTPKSDDELVE